MQVKLIYFKRTGKYYAEGGYTSRKEWPSDVYKEVRKMAEDNSLPGLIKGHSDFIVLVQPEDDGVPALIGSK